MKASPPADLSELAGLDRQALCQRWVDTFGTPAPRSCQASLLRQVLAWQLQRQAHPQWRGPAGLAQWRRLLRQPASLPAMQPGTQLLREWQGQTQRVTVKEEGFEYNGTTYRSLSAIARRITGTAWSGPAFFGLRGGGARG
jgi:hypothetical protein